MSQIIGLLFILHVAGGAIVELDDTNFMNYAKDREVLLVDFHTPWCCDCKKLEPEIQAAAASLGARSIDVAKVDCNGAGKGLCEQYGIHEVPTLKNFNKGVFTGDYTGPQTAAEIAGHINTAEAAIAPQAVANPYAAPNQPAADSTQQQCVSRCKISKRHHKGACIAKCKTSKK